MPYKPKRPCNKAGCPELTDGRFCSKHQDIAQQQRKERHKHYDKYQRDQQATAFYHSKEWDLARQQAIMRDHGLCQDCLAEKRIMMADVLLRLSDRERECYLLHMAYGLSWAEISTELKLSKTSVQKYIERARSKVGQGV